MAREFVKLNLEIIQEGKHQLNLKALLMQPLFFEKVLSSQDGDPKLVKLKEHAREGKAEGFSIHEYGSLRVKGQ